jgi:TrmH family RNA methyltransferase
VAAIPRHGTSLFGIDLTGPLAVLVGGEGAGLSQVLVEQSDDRLSVPMESPVESLNTAVSAALVVYEARRQRLGLEGR